jgi:hypothetical protein
MGSMNARIVTVALALFGLTTSCLLTTQPPAEEPAALISPLATHTPSHTSTSTSAPTRTVAPSTPAPTDTPLPTAAAEVTYIPGPSGPETYPPGVNPLSGLPVEDPDRLLLPPALISVSNSPVTTRPQAGLSYAPLVFEIYIGEGATRFLALFYGDYPPAGSAVKPIRSGRLPYETLRTIYNGWLAFAGASPRNLAGISQYQTITNKTNDINGAEISAQDIERLSGEYVTAVGTPNLSGLRFDPQPPRSGKPAAKVWVDFSYTAQVFWHYNAEWGAYQRLQDSGPDTPLETATDRLNGEPLTIENLVVVFADYHWYDRLFFNIDLLYVKRHPALLFRDGQVYEIYWTTRNEDPEWQTGRLRPIRFVTYSGEPVPLKPGNTWVELVQLHASVYETTDTTAYNQLAANWEPGSGVWAVRHYIPAFVPTPIGWPDQR